MRRAGCALPLVTILLSCAGGAPLLVGESSLNLTPEMMRTVAVAWTATGADAVALLVGAVAAIAAARRTMCGVGNALRS